MVARLVAQRTTISPFAPLPSTLHYHVMWSLVFWGAGWKEEVRGAEKSLSLKGGERVGREYCVRTRAVREAWCINGGGKRKRAESPFHLPISLVTHPFHIYSGWELPGCKGVAPC